MAANAPTSAVTRPFLTDERLIAFHSMPSGDAICSGVAGFSRRSNPFRPRPLIDVHPMSAAGAFQASANHSHAHLGCAQHLSSAALYGTGVVGKSPIARDIETAERVEYRL